MNIDVLDYNVVVAGLRKQLELEHRAWQQQNDQYHAQAELAALRHKECEKLREAVKTLGDDCTRRAIDITRCLNLIIGGYRQDTPETLSGQSLFNHILQLQAEVRTLRARQKSRKSH